jgi:glyoxylase-like metal-dependent hydrolase (beta-lactamase superfamily II)
LREISFDGSLKYDQYNAVDFFGDGSFYLLDTPGHAVGHMAGLVRTTSNPDTFAMLGGDLCHSAGQIRPSQHLPFPAEIRFDPAHVPASSAFSICPGSCFEAIQTKRGRAKDEPIFDTVFGHDVAEANKTIRKTLLPDAQGNLLFLGAHDNSLHGIVDLFPAAANDWKSKGWKEAMHWAFLTDFTGSIKHYE